MIPSMWMLDDIYTDIGHVIHLTEYRKDHWNMNNLHDSLRLCKCHKYKINKYLTLSIQTCYETFNNIIQKVWLSWAVIYNSVHTLGSCLIL